MRELCSNSRLRSNLFFSNFIWGAIMINYYIIAFYLKYFPGDIYSNTFAFVVADLLSYILSIMVLKRTSMIKTLVIA